MERAVSSDGKIVVRVLPSLRKPVREIICEGGFLAEHRAELLR